MMEVLSPDSSHMIGQQLIINAVKVWTHHSFYISWWEICLPGTDADILSIEHHCAGIFHAIWDLTGLLEHYIDSNSHFLFLFTDNCISQKCQKWKSSKQLSAIINKFGVSKYMWSENNIPPFLWKMYYYYGLIRAYS